MALSLYNGRFILLISASFVTIFSSIAIYFCLPIFISHIIRTQLALGPNSGSFNDWRLNYVEDRIYLYNITNFNDVFNSNNNNEPQATTTVATMSAIAATTARQTSSRPIPRLKQIGPFTFRQIREKININFNTVNETVMYDQKKSWVFLPKLSIANSLEELNSSYIYHINIPLAGTTLNAEYAEFIEPIVTEFDLKLFLNHTIKTLLFDGYHDILMEAAKSQGQIDVDRFGWMHNLNNSVSKDIRVFTGPSNATLDKLGSIDQVKYTNRIDVWRNFNNTPSFDNLKTTSNSSGNVQCNEFRFTSLGEFFPPPDYSIISHNNQQQPKKSTDNIIEKTSSTSLLSAIDSIESTSNGLILEKEQSEKRSPKTVSIYMPDLCRVFRLVYNKTYNYKGLSVDRYIANEFTFDYTTSDTSPDQDGKQQQPQQQEASNPNRCFCLYNENTKLSSCPPNGMMDFYSCRKGSPLTISFPHFLYSNRDKTLAPYLRLFDDDTAPTESEHQFYLDLESTLNIPVKVQMAIQFNVHYRNEPSLNFTHDYSFLFDSPSSSSMKQTAQDDSNKTTRLADFYLPQMWLKSTAEIDEGNLRNLKFIQNHLKFVTPIATTILVAFASILLIMSAKLAYDLTYGPKSRKPISSRDRPIHFSRLTAVRSSQESCLQRAARDDKL